MPILERVISGNIFLDNFDSVNLDKRWTASPSLDSRYSLVERPGYLRIKHADTPTYILTDIPNTEQLMFEIKNDYKPVVSTDIGGIVVFKTIDDRVELVEYYDPVIDVSRNYLYVRMYKNGDVYDGYGSQDGITWELIGSARIEDAAKIGLVLNGAVSPLSVPLDVDSVSAYRDRFLYVENLQPGMKAQLIDKDNDLVKEYVVDSSESVARFDMFALPLPFEGYIKLYTPTNSLLFKTPTQMLYPGDEFQYIINLKVKFQRRIITLKDDGNGVMIPKSEFISDTDFVLDDVVNIGGMESNTMEGLVTVENLDDMDIVGLEAYVELFTNAYATHKVQLARDEYGSPSNYQDKVIISIPAKSSVSFWMKVTATNIQTISKKDMFRYKLCFRNA